MSKVFKKNIRRKEIIIINALKTLTMTAYVRDTSPHSQKLAQVLRQHSRQDQCVLQAGTHPPYRDAIVAANRASWLRGHANSQEHEARPLVRAKAVLLVTRAGVFTQLTKKKKCFKK